MNDEEWLENIEKMAYAVREILFLSSEEVTEKEAAIEQTKKLRDEIGEIIRNLEGSRSMMRVISVKTFPQKDGTKKILNERLAEFIFGPEYDEAVTVAVGVIIDDRHDSIRVRRGNIVISPRSHFHTCAGCEELSLEDIRNGNLDALDSILAYFGFGSLTRKTIFVFEDNERHPMLEALRCHRDKLFAACRQQEYLITQEELTYLISNGSAIDTSNGQRFAFSFLARKELEYLFSFPSGNILPCSCTVETHRNALAAWHERNLAD